MGEERDLESKLELEGAGLESQLVSTKPVSPFANYLVDTTAAWLYWTPVMTLTETLSGMESKEILKSRLMSIALHTFVGRPYGLFRQYWANLWNADASSSRLKKIMVDTSAQICFQVPTYSTILYFSGASLKEGVAALVTGLTVGTLSGRPFGYVQDKWRKLWGARPTLDE